MTGERVLLTDLGRRDFGGVWHLQRSWADEIAAGASERLVLVEHDDVITKGRGTKPENVLATPFPVHEIERGGDVTYHGPGQLVGYPLLRLAGRGLGVHTYLRALEETLVRALATFGLTARAVPRKTGVWVEERKVASIGIAVRQGVSFHGFALNVATDLSKFGAINPCGFEATVMTSLEALLGERVRMAQAKRAVLDAFEAVFGSRLTVEGPAAVVPS